MQQKQDDQNVPVDVTHADATQTSCPAEAVAPTTTDISRPDLPRHFDVHNHFWPKKKQSGDEEKPVAMSDGLHHSTLNGSAETPNQLKYIMLFTEANPRWKSDGIIFVKSSLSLLPGIEKFDRKESVRKVTPRDEGVTPAADREEGPDTTRTAETGDAAQEVDIYEATYTPDLSLYKLDPIAVFEQVGGKNGRFEFAGFYEIKRLQFLEPYSDELHRMLLQKFSKVDRDGNVIQQQRSRQAWEASMSHRWAVMKLEKTEDAGLADPEIKVSEVKPTVRKPRQPKKGVNELLKEIRLKDENVTGGSSMTETTVGKEDLD